MKFLAVSVFESSLSTYELLISVHNSEDSFNTVSAKHSFNTQMLFMRTIQFHSPGLYRFDCLLKFGTKTHFNNMFFNAHSENVLFSGFFCLKTYYDLKLFISYVFVKKLELEFFYVLHVIR